MLFDKYPIIKLANRLMCRNIERCLVLGESLRRQYDGVLHPSKIDVLPNFADSALFMTEAEIEAKFASNGPLQVLYLSNLLPGKGYKELTLALKCLEESGYEGKVEAVFAGAFENDAIRDEFLGLIEGSRVIRYAGVVSGEAKKRSLQESHVFCLPSYYKFLEGQPLSILEAYAAGCAVLSTDHGGIKDIFGARNGVVVQKESVDSLVEALKGFISDRRRAREYALFNNSTARTKYSVESFERNLVNAFNLDKGSVLENPL